jgi:Domain of unknown function (DUF4276)
VTEVRVYFEGDKALRPGFSQFLGPIREKASNRKIRFQLIAGKGNAERDFLIAQKTHQQALNVLLKDSEGPGATNENCVFWMVQLMESWFLADPEKLASYYGNGFSSKALKPNPRVEEIPKADVLECLKQATKNTQKGAYHKTAHAPSILASLGSDTVRKAAPNCDRLFRELLAKLDE